MDGAQASLPMLDRKPFLANVKKAFPSRVGRGARGEGAAREGRWNGFPGADLGSSSKYSNGILEGRSGEGFHVDGDRSWVSRS